MDIRAIVNDLLAPLRGVLGDHNLTKSLLIVAAALIVAKVLDWLMRRVIRRFTSSAYRPG